MEKVKVKRLTLLSKLTDNRKVHAEEFEKALGAYRDVAISRLTDMLTVAKNGGAIATRTDLVEPVSKVAEYDRAIAMLDMSVEDNIDLTQDEFDCLVLDNWKWKSMATYANKLYTG